MSKISKVFEKGKVFIPFVTCGDPDLETTAEVVRAAVELSLIHICLYGFRTFWMIPIQRRCFL